MKEITINSLAHFLRLFETAPERILWVDDVYTEVFDPNTTLTSIVDHIADGCLRETPDAIDINSYEVPKPMKERPANMTIFFIADILNNPGPKSGIIWDIGDDKTNLKWLKAGLCHKTWEAAAQHRKALLSFTEAI